jgi:hypothetical protein
MTPLERHADEQDAGNDRGAAPYVEHEADRLTEARRIAGLIRRDVPDRSNREDALVALDDEVERLGDIVQTLANELEGRDILANNSVTRVVRLRAGIEVLDSDLDRGRASGRIYTYGQIQLRLRALLAEDPPMTADRIETAEALVALPVSVWEEAATLVHDALQEHADECEAQGIPAARVSAIRHAANVGRMALSEHGAEVSAPVATLPSRPDVHAAGLRVTREAVEAEWVPDFQRLREYAIDRFAESEKAREYAVWEHRWREQAEAERDFLRTEVEALADGATDDTGHGAVDVVDIRRVLNRAPARGAGGDVVTANHRPPCVNGDHCGEPAHCPPSDRIDTSETESPHEHTWRLVPAHTVMSCGHSAFPAAGLQVTRAEIDVAQRKANGSAATYKRWLENFLAALGVTVVDGVQP